jgi:Asp-tRNA(Asn)/Glu-tRNA(Gln) amidotransferase A subunit family amidase
LTRRGRAPRQLRIGIRTGSWSDQLVDPEVAAATERVGTLLESLGHTVEETEPFINIVGGVQAEECLDLAYDSVRQGSMCAG